MDYALYYEIMLWIILAISVFLFVANLGVGGALGQGIASFFFGMFGIMAFVFPFVLFFLTAFLISNSRNNLAKIKSFGVVLLFITLCALFQMLLVGWNSNYALNEYYDAGSAYHTGGGMVGGAIAALFCPAIGVVGFYLVQIIMLVISFILITQRSIMKSVKRSSKAMVANAREGHERRAAWAAQRAEEREQARMLREEVSYTDSDELADDFSLSILPERASTRMPRRDRKAVGVSPVARMNLQDRLANVPAGQAVDVSDLANAAVADSESTPSRPARTAAPSRPAKPAKTRQRILPDISFEDDDFDHGDMKEITFEPDAMSDIRDSIGDMKISGMGFDNKPKAEKAVDASANLSSAAEDIHERVMKIKEEAAAPSRPTAPAAPALKPAAAPMADYKDDEDDYVDSSRAAAEQRMLSSGGKLSDEPVSGGAAGAESDGEHRTRTTKPHASKEEIEEGINDVAAEIAQNAPVVKKVYKFPDIDLLSKPKPNAGGTTQEQLVETATKLAQVFKTFGVNVKVTNVTCGPSVTRYELMPEMGVKVSKIVNLQDDIKLNLAASDIRIEAPIPGKAAVGIEVPNKKPTGVMLRELLESPEFENHPSNLAYAVGRDIAGNIIVSDIQKMPHLLIAGSTGSGKSVFINTLIMSILYKSSPDDVKLIMIDPKVVELSVYNGIPHLFIPVVTDPKKAAGALNWAVAEMTTRYQKFAEIGVRDIKGYNKRVAALEEKELPEGEERPTKMPQIVIIVDELADLMMVSSSEVEQAICRLAQLARAAGIHLVIATQRPSVDVITGLIKANMPSRIAFSVSSGTDSRTILDMNGAEKLLGNGDMLFAPQTFKQPLRVQGAFVSDQEVASIVDFMKDNNMSEGYSDEMQKQIESVEKTATLSANGGSDTDELFADAGRMIIDKDKASIGMLQRYFKIGFNRAARIMDQLADAGVVGPEEGTKPRKVLMGGSQFEDYLEMH